MTDKVQKIREEITKKLEVMQYQIHRKDAYKELKSILNYMDSLQEEPNILPVFDEGYWERLGEDPVSEDLGEVSKNYALNNTPWDDCKDEIQEAFKAGAKWQKEQMIAKAIDAVVSQVPCSNEIILYNPASVHWSYLPQEMNKLGVNKGDKVKVIVTKED